MIASDDLLPWKSGTCQQRTGANDGKEEEGSVWKEGVAVHEIKFG
jgi:hypothetical protein